MNRGDGAAYLTDELLFCFQLISLIIFLCVCVFVQGEECEKRLVERHPTKVV